MMGRYCGSNVLTLFSLLYIAASHTAMYTVFLVYCLLSHVYTYYFLEHVTF